MPMPPRGIRWQWRAVPVSARATPAMPAVAAPAPSRARTPRLVTPLSIRPKVPEKALSHQKQPTPDFDRDLNQVPAYRATGPSTVVTGPTPRSCHQLARRGVVDQAVVGHTAAGDDVVV